MPYTTGKNNYKKNSMVAERKVFMNEIKNVIHDELETLRSSLDRGEEALERSNKIRPTFRKRMNTCLLIVLVLLLPGIIAFISDGQIPLLIFVGLGVAGILVMYIYGRYADLDTKLYGVQLVCKRCIPQLKKYIEFASSNKISEITYTAKGLDLIVTVTAQTSDGEKVTLDMRCAEETSPNVTEPTLDVSKMTVYFPTKE